MKPYTERNFKNSETNFELLNPKRSHSKSEINSTHNFEAMASHRFKIEFYCHTISAIK